MGLVVFSSIYLYSTYILFLVNNRLSGEGDSQGGVNPKENGLEGGQDTGNPEEQSGWVRGKEGENNDFNNLVALTYWWLH